MLFLLFSQALIEHQSFTVDFSPNCSEFMILDGRQDYLYLNKTNELHLWLKQNSSYEVYSTPITKTVIFSWPDKSINGIPMKPSLKHGNVKYPLVFENENVMCQMLGERGGTLDVEYEEVTVYKCQKNRDWWLITAIITFIVLAVVLTTVIRYEPAKVILQSTISWIVRWRQQILSRSEEDSSQDHQGDNCSISEIPTSIYTTQTIQKTTQV